MRFMGVTLTALFALSPLIAAQAAEPQAVARAPALQLAHDDSQSAVDEERRIEQEERELRERKRALRERRRDEREEVRALAVRPRAWVAVGAGVAAGSVDHACSSSSSTNDDCTSGGTFGTYSANITITGPYSAMRVRGVREQDRDGNAHVPYEEAALIGSRFGRSDWYGLAGFGRVVHPDDKHPDDAHGFAWEIVYAPSSIAVTGIELSFLGNLGPDVEYVGFNIGMRLGALR